MNDYKMFEIGIRGRYKRKGYDIYFVQDNMPMEFIFRVDDLTSRYDHHVFDELLYSNGNLRYKVHENDAREDKKELKLLFHKNIKENEGILMKTHVELPVTFIQEFGKSPFYFNGEKVNVKSLGFDIKEDGYVLNIDEFPNNIVSDVSDFQIHRFIELLEARGLTCEIVDEI